MAEEERERQRSFKVEDRRRFSTTGEARDEAAPAGDTPASEDAGGATTAAAPPPAAEPSAGSGAARPAITFATFLISLSTQALALLGEIPDPVERATRVDLEGARQIIDILGILSDKTRGNLDASETALLDGALFDLRMKYVERAQGR